MKMGVHQAVEIVEVNEREPWEACKLSYRETPTPGPCQALIRILCRPINPADVLSMQGHYGGSEVLLPRVPGFEGMGVVHQVGENVTNVVVGQRVVPLSNEPGQGLWQQYILVPALHLIPIPDSMSDDVAAQLVVNPWSVIGLFHELGAPKGEYILQTAASSVLGRMFIQYAHYQGVKTINLVRHDKQKEELKILGADEVINIVDGDVVEKVKKITRGKMAYGAIDCVGGEITKVVVESLRDNGTLLVSGLLASLHVKVGIRDLIFRGVKVQGFWAATWLNGLSPSERLDKGAHLMNLLENKIIYPSIGKKYSLDEVKEAIKKSLEPQHGGKVLLVSY